MYNNNNNNKRQKRSVLPRHVRVVASESPCELSSRLTIRGSKSARTSGKLSPESRGIKMHVTLHSGSWTVALEDNGWCVLFLVERKARASLFFIPPPPRFLSSPHHPRSRVRQGHHGFISTRALGYLSRFNGPFKLYPSPHPLLTCTHCKETPRKVCI